MPRFYLADDDELIRKKVMKAKTDSGPAELIPLSLIILKIFLG